MSTGIQIPSFLLGVTKENVSVKTIDDVHGTKNYKRAETWASVDEKIKRLNHHIVDYRGVRYMKQLLIDNQIIDEKYRFEVNEWEASNISKIF